jgi:hypothetical protein
MSPPRFLPIFLSAVGLIAVGACTDSPSAPYIPTFTSPAPSLTTLRGIVHVTGRSVPVLTTDDNEWALAGPELSRLESVDGADVEVRGTWDAVGALLVSDFLVRAIDGVEAMDGVLMEIYAYDFDEEFIGYGLRLTRTALVVPLTDPPNGLLEHLGERVWVTGAVNGPPSAFGVIGRAQR